VCVFSRALSSISSRYLLSLSSLSPLSSLCLSVNLMHLCLSCGSAGFSPDQQKQLQLLPHAHKCLLVQQWQGEKKKGRRSSSPKGPYASHPSYVPFRWSEAVPLHPLHMTSAAAREVLLPSPSRVLDPSVLFDVSHLPPNAGQPLRLPPIRRQTKGAPSLESPHRPEEMARRHDIDLLPFFFSHHQLPPQDSRSAYAKAKIEAKYRSMGIIE